MVDAGIATPMQANVYVEAMARREARRMQARDDAIAAKRDKRRGLARVLNIGG